MELKDFIKKFLKYWPLLAVFTIVGFFAGLVFDQTRQLSFSTSVLVYFSPASSEQLLPTANEFTDTILGVLLNQNLVKIATVEIKKAAPQLLEFTISAPDKDQVVAARKELPKQVENKLTEVIGKDRVLAKPLNLESQINQPPNLLFLNLAVGGILGLAVGASVVSIMIYFKA